MGSEWKKIMLGDVAEIIMGQSPPGSTYNEIGKGLPFYQGTTDFGERFPSRRIFCSAPIRLSDKGDILLSIRAPIGRVNRAVERCSIGRGLAVVRCKNLFDTTFIEYILRSLSHYWNSLENQGSVFGNAKRDDLEKLILIWPTESIRHAIAHILGSLDDKIELNRRMNKTLEAIARAIFKSWFIDFDPVIDNALRAGNSIPDSMAERAEIRRQILEQNQPSSSSQRVKDRNYLGGFDFSNLGNVSIDEIHGLFPDSFQDSELGEIPKGWEVITLSEFLNIIGGGTPKTKVKEYWGGDIPWFSVVDAPSETDVFVIDTEKHVTQLGVERSSTKVLRKGTTIISARGTVGKCALLGRPMAMNQSCYGIQGKNGESDYFIYFVIKRQVSDLQRSGHGSVFNTITRDTFRTIRTILPPTKLTILFEDTVCELMELILSNLFENLTLASLRDTLLPKLISGELRIQDTEKFLKEVGV
jgi:type I restriction enzyme S subunit